MKILAIVEDEIIKSLFEKKYVPLLKNLEIDFGEYNNSFKDKIKEDYYNVVICDLDTNLDDVVDFYANLKQFASFLFITDWEYERYLELLNENKISNIYPKGLLIEDYTTSAKFISNLNNCSVFGIENYTEDPSLLETIAVHYSSEIRKLNTKIGFLFPDLDKEKSLKIKLAFSEIASNAFYHSHGIKKGKEDYIEEPIYISFAEDSKKILFSVEDKVGSLTKEIVYYWILKRTQNDSDLPLEHGRGFFLMKNIIDNLIINIKEKQRAEFIAIFYKEEYMGEKALVIHQLD